MQYNEEDRLEMEKKIGELKNPIEISDGNKEEQLGEQKEEELGSSVGTLKRESKNRERTCKSVTRRDI